jgi:hypothetical protein
MMMRGEVKTAAALLVVVAQRVMKPEVAVAMGSSRVLLTREGRQAAIYASIALDILLASLSILSNCRNFSLILVAFLALGPLQSAKTPFELAQPFESCSQTGN